MSVHTYEIVKIIDSGLCAAYFYYFALRGFISKIPFLVSMKWSFVLLLLIFLPRFASVHLPNSILIHPLTHPNDLDSFNWISVLLIMLLILFFWKILNGHTVWGITEESFRKILLTALDKSNVKYKEDMNGIHLKSSDIDLKVFYFWGMGRIRINGNNNGKLLKKLIPVFKKELEKPNVVFDSKSFVISFWIAVLISIGLILEIAELRIIERVLGS